MFLLMWKGCQLQNIHTTLDHRHLCGAQFYQKVTLDIPISPVRKQDQRFPVEDLVLSCNSLNIDH